MTETLLKLGMGALFVASVPADGVPELWLQWGLAGIVVGYTLHRDWQRQKRMSEALERHQAWVQQTLLGALERSSIAIEKLTALQNERKAFDDRNASARG
jgi:hypothetical protein